MTSVLQSVREMQPLGPPGGIDRAGMYQGSIWPNGRFGFRRKPSEGYSYKKELEDTIDVWCETGLRELPLSVPSNSHSHIKRKSKKRGTMGITGFGRKMIENGAFVLDKRFGRGRLSFGTLTLPSVTQEEGWIVSTHWAEIVRVFFQRLTRMLGRAGLPKRYLYVTEMQPKRSEREGHPALHLHFVFVGAFVSGKWVITTDTVVDAWSDVLSKYLPGERYYRKRKVLEGVKKSVECYLGKYLSKGSDTEFMQPPEEMLYSLPSSWWGMCDALRRFVKGKRITGNQALSFIHEALNRGGTQAMFQYQGVFERETNVGMYVAAYYGKIDRNQLRDVWQILKVLDTC